MDQIINIDAVIILKDIYLIIDCPTQVSLSMSRRFFFRSSATHVWVCMWSFKLFRNVALTLMSAHKTKFSWIETAFK